MKRYSIRKQNDHTWPIFFKRTISAQIPLAALIASLVGLGVFIAMPQISGTNLWACSIFVLSGALTMFVSTTYHFMSDGFEINDRLMLALENLDHFCIYIFIAGSYTPFLIAVVQPPWRGWLMLSVWITAGVGILYTQFKPRLPKWAQSRIVYTGVFILMGWTLVVRIQEVWTALNGLNFLLLVGGGLAYSLGAVVYVFKKPNPFPKVFGFHEIWHVAVACGFGIHYWMIYNLFA